MKKNRTGRYSALTLLGNSETSFPQSPAKAKLETFQNPCPKRDYVIRIESEEFTSLCPVTGQPDFAEILLEYTPDALCLETKALKFYLSSFRNVHAFNEDVVNKMLDDLVAVCSPRWMQIVGKFASRGGLSLTVTAQHSQQPVNQKGRSQ